MDAATSSDKTFVPVEGGFHELMREDCGAQLIKANIDWILARAGPAKL
jgi:alpha-beta hydrolase superfamily lysophospholipase